MEATFSLLVDQFKNPEEIREWLKVGRQEIEHAQDLTGTQVAALVEDSQCERACGCLSSIA